MLYPFRQILSANGHINIHVQVIHINRAKVPFVSHIQPLDRQGAEWVFGLWSNPGRQYNTVLIQIDSSILPQKPFWECKSQVMFNPADIGEEYSLWGQLRLQGHFFYFNGNPQSETPVDAI